MRLALLAGLTLFLSVAAADVSGVWTLNFEQDFGGHPGTSDCTFKQDGKKLTVRCGHSQTTSPGEVNGRRLRWQSKTGLHEEVTATFTADLDDQATTLKSTWHLPDREGQFTARKH
jgi:hypothetical protein